MSRARRYARIPQAGELWQERSPRRRGQMTRCVLIISTDATHAHVENVRTRRKSTIMLSEFTQGILTGWYRRYAPRPVPFPDGEDENEAMT